MAKRKLSARLVIFGISFLALIFLSWFLYERTHWKISIAAKNDLGVPLYVEIDVCDKHKEIKLDAKEFRIGCCLSIKSVDYDLIYGTLRIFDEAKDCLLYETKLNRHESILANNNDEFPLRLDFMIFQNSNGNCDVAFDPF